MSLYESRFGVLIRAVDEDRGNRVKKSTESQDTHNVSLIKSAQPEEERFVFGVVLEPTKELGKPDSQGDIYSAEEVRNACHDYMQKHQTIGLQHKQEAGDKVKILENYIAPADFEIDGKKIAKGTWLLGVRVVDDEIWEGVKKGAITGFSIGGFAKRKRVG